jgi:hypothetical protein
MRAAVLLLLALGGCTAGRSVYYVWSAQRGMDGAVEAGAETRAAYEYTLAREYLAKAREESGYSDFKDAEVLARKARTWADKAVDVARFGTSERELMLEEAGEVVPEEIIQPTYKPMVPLEDGED